MENNQPSLNFSSTEYKDIGVSTYLLIGYIFLYLIPKLFVKQVIIFILVFLFFFVREFFRLKFDLFQIYSSSKFWGLAKVYPCQVVLI